MTQFIHTLLTQSFLQNALLAAIIGGVLSGLTGSFVVVKKIVSLSGGIAHAVLGGVGIAFYLQLNPIMGAYVAAFFVALILALIKFKAKQQEDIAIASVWTAGMALGIIFLNLKPGYNTELSSFLFGNILLVSKHNLQTMLSLGAVVALAFYFLFRQFVAISFDEEQAFLNGLHVKLLYVVLLILISITIVSLIQAVGMLLVIAMLTLPAATASLFTYKLKKMILLSIAASIFYSICGIVISYYTNLPSGAVIILFSLLMFIVAVLIKKLRNSVESKIKS